MRFFKTIVQTAIALLGLSLFSCTGLIYDTGGEGACKVSVRFKYDYNMKFADAFANEVHSVSVFVFDPATGRLVARASDSGNHLAGDYYLSIPDLPAGRYDLVAWCGLEGSGFTVSDPKTKDELFCIMNTVTRAASCSDKDPGALYYGYAGNVHLDILPQGAANTVVLDLIKNTNSIKVVLQALNSSSPLLPDEYDFVISDDNAVLDWKNEASPAAEVDYYPWDKRQGSVKYDDNDTYLTAAVAEFTTSRLFKKNEDKVMLAVVDKTTGQKVINIPMVDYFLMVKGNYNRDMADQEFLDRQDDYQITFFLDNTRGWSIASGIFINGWHVVLQDTVLD